MTRHDYDEFPRNAEPEPGDDRAGQAPEAGPAPPSPDDLLLVADIMAMYGISRSAVRQWRLKPFDRVRIGSSRYVLRYRRADVEAYAGSTRRLNRLPKV